eukprot:4334099-Pyramimonas_sp.AAC.1
MTRATDATRDYDYDFLKGSVQLSTGQVAPLDWKLYVFKDDVTFLEVRGLLDTFYSGTTTKWYTAR